MLPKLFLQILTIGSLSLSGLGGVTLVETLMSPLPPPMPVQPTSLTEPVSQSAVIAAALLFTIGIRSNCDCSG